MNNIKNIYISYWFNKLDFNPSTKVNDLEDEIKSIIDTPILYTDDNNLNNISIPRIKGASSDKKYFFTLSLINAILSIDVSDITIDEAILLINSNTQLFYDIIKKIYNIKVVYTSIKLELIDEGDSKDKLIKLLNLTPNDYEDLSFKRGIIKDDYYINYILTYTKEYNFNIKNNQGLTEQDLFEMSMLTSISDAKLCKEFLLTIIEINDRYAYNTDNNHETSKDIIRGMIIELKDILSNKLYNKL